jgi:hypothetical protein
LADSSHVLAAIVFWLPALPPPQPASASAARTGNAQLLMIRAPSVRDEVAQLQANLAHLL